MYLLWIQQAGKGCDYTIGCSEVLVCLSNSKEPETLTPDDLAKKVLGTLEYYGFTANSPDRELEACRLFEAKELPLNAKELIDTARKIEAEIAKEEKESAERREFARLRAKYG